MPVPCGDVRVHLRPGLPVARAAPVLAGAGTAGWPATSPDVGRITVPAAAGPSRPLAILERTHLSTHNATTAATTATPARVGSAGTRTTASTPTSGPRRVCRISRIGMAPTGVSTWARLS